MRPGRIGIEYIGAGQYDIIGPNDASVNAGPDYCLPGVAQLFGMVLRHKRGCASPGNTDGSVDCSECGQTVDKFIVQASNFLDNVASSGRTTEDPGYFGEWQPQ